MSNILEVKDISVNYGNIKALTDVSITIKEEEIVSLIGANGAGKSTLLKSIVGLEPLRTGEVNFDGEVICSTKDLSDKMSFFKRKKGFSTDHIVSKGIALVPEGRGVFAHMTVQENLEMGAFIEKDQQKIKDRIDLNFSLFPILGDRRKQKAGSLSGGEQQMLAIGRALMSSPKLLLLDEPGLGLAPLIIKDIFEIIKKINKEDKVTIFIVEQNAKLALSNSHTGYVMETGAIVMHDKSANLLDNDKVRKAYLGE